MATRVLVPSGVLGLGFDRDALRRAAADKPDIICIDGGSTDSGPFYLGAGVSKYSDASVRSEWQELLAARAAAGCPLVLGSAGTCGTDAMVDGMLAATRAIAEAEGRRLRIATLKSEQPAASVRGALEAGRLAPLAGVPEGGISADDIAGCTHIVALAGAEQIAAALQTGADVVIAGRATDTAAISALPLMRGEHAGAAWHGAKIGECGALCSTRPMSGVIGLEFDGAGCTVEPHADGARCTPESVAAHMLYENADPFVLHEPGGHLDARGAAYEALDERRVRISGSRWVASETYTVKLEGARLAGYQTTALAILRDGRYVANARRWLGRLEAFLGREIPARTGLGPQDYDIEFRLIGVDAALGPLETRASDPVEVGVLAIFAAATQATATEIARLANPFLLHFPLTDDEELPTFAFPYSPAETERGPLYEFALNHVMRLDDPMEAFRLEVTEVGNGPAG